MTPAPGDRSKQAGHRPDVQGLGAGGEIVDRPLPESGACRGGRCPDLLGQTRADLPDHAHNFLTAADRGRMLRGLRWQRQNMFVECSGSQDGENRQNMFAAVRRTYAGKRALSCIRVAVGAAHIDGQCVPLSIGNSQPPQHPFHLLRSCRHEPPAYRPVCDATCCENATAPPCASRDPHRCRAPQAARNFIHNARS